MLEQGELDDLINEKDFITVKQSLEELNWNLGQVNERLGLYGSNHIIFSISVNPILNAMFKEKISSLIEKYGKNAAAITVELGIDVGTLLKYFKNNHDIHNKFLNDQNRTFSLETKKLVSYLKREIDKTEDVFVTIKASGRPTGRLNIEGQEIFLHVSKNKELVGKKIIREAAEFNDGSRGVIFWLCKENNEKDFPLVSYILADRSGMILNNKELKRFPFHILNMPEEKIPFTQDVEAMRLIYWLATGKNRPAENKVVVDLHGFATKLYSLGKARVLNFISLNDAIIGKEILREAVDFPDHSRGVIYWHLKENGEKDFPLFSYILADENGRFYESKELKGFQYNILNLQREGIPFTMDTEAMKLIHWLATGENEPEETRVNVTTNGSATGLYSLGGECNPVRNFISNIFISDPILISARTYLSRPHLRDYTRAP